MKITIVTPSYNQGNYLEQTINSVINQDYKDIEYIIIDGGSTDNSVDIIRKYENKIAYWVSEKDNGQTYAINKGFKMATGSIVGWLNSDDYLEPNALEKIGEVFKKEEDIGTVYGRINIVDENGFRISERFNQNNIAFDTLLNGSAQVNQPGSFHRRELFEKHGYLDETLNYVMDYEIWVRFAQYSKIKQLNECVANHRLHESSKTMSEFIKFVPEIKKVRKKYGGKYLCRKSFDIFRVEVGYLRKKLFGC